MTAPEFAAQKTAIFTQLNAADLIAQAQGAPAVPPDGLTPEQLAAFAKSNAQSGYQRLVDAAAYVGQFVAPMLAELSKAPTMDAPAAPPAPMTP